MTVLPPEPPLLPVPLPLTGAPDPAAPTELASGEKIVGPDVTIKMAKDEGWYNKNGSKWKTIPQLMLMYRSAGWMINTAAPEISMGLPTQEELHDIIDVRPDGTLTFGGVEEGSVRAPAAVEVPQPQSKSSRAAEKPAIAQADADGAAYRELFAKNGTVIEDRYGLGLRADGTYRLVPYTDKSDWSVFLSLLTLRNWKEKYGHAIDTAGESASAAP
ncbi:hypothetical protein LGN03_08970 [Burkholderia multivorans]|nr:hypothetical protein [Burkholderia multivorans]